MSNEPASSFEFDHTLKPLHLVEEISHRVINEYAEAVSALDLAASSTTDQQARNTLTKPLTELDLTFHRGSTPPPSGSHCRPPRRCWSRSRLPRPARRGRSPRRRRAASGVSAWRRTIGPGRAARRRIASASASASPSNRTPASAGASSGTSAIVTRWESSGRQPFQRHCLRPGSRSRRCRWRGSRRSGSSAALRLVASAAILPRRRSA